MDNTQNKIVDGKKISKYNATRHGVLMKVLLPEEAEEAQTIQEQLTDEYQPETLTEKLLIESMAIAYIRRERAINAEREYMLQILNPPVWEERVITAPLIENLQSPSAQLYGEKEVVLVKEGYKAKITNGEINVVDTTFARYINTCERQFFKSLHELQRVQAVRKGLKPTSVAVDFTGERSEE